jgi:hypothetical protein
LPPAGSSRYPRRDTARHCAAPAIIFPHYEICIYVRLLISLPRATCARSRTRA